MNGSEEAKILEWPSQSSDLTPIKTLWQNLEQSILAQKPSSVAELKPFIDEEWTKILPQQCEKHILSYLKHLIAVVAQPAFKFRGQLLFYMGDTGVGKLCFNK